MDRTFKVFDKGLSGKKETPTIKFKNDDGERLTLHFPFKKQLGNFEIDEIFTVKVVKAQRTLDEIPEQG